MRVNNGVSSILLTVLLMRCFLYLLLITVAWPISAQSYRCPDAKGRVFFSNIGCNENQRPIAAGNSGYSGRVNAVSLIAMMDGVTLEKDAVKRQSMVQAIHSNVAVYKAQAIAEVQSQAETKAGVPELEKQLRESEAADRADPKWSDYRSDSQITANIRPRLMAAREYANRSSAGLLDTNVDYARLMARYSEFKKYN